MPDNSHDLFVRELKSVLEKYYALREARQRHPDVGDLIRVPPPYPEPYLGDFRAGEAAQARWPVDSRRVQQGRDAGPPIPSARLIG